MFPKAAFGERQLRLSVGDLETGPVKIGRRMLKNPSKFAIFLFSATEPLTFFNKIH